MKWFRDFSKVRRAVTQWKVESLSETSAVNILQTQQTYQILANVSTSNWEQRLNWLGFKSVGQLPCNYDLVSKFLVTKSFCTIKTWFSKVLKRLWCRPIKSTFCAFNTTTCIVSIWKFSWYYAPYAVERSTEEQALKSLKDIFGAVLLSKVNSEFELILFSCIVFYFLACI